MESSKILMPVRRSRTLPRKNPKPQRHPLLPTMKGHLEKRQGARRRKSILWSLFDPNLRSRHRSAAIPEIAPTRACTNLSCASKHDPGQLVPSVPCGSVFLTKLLTLTSCRVITCIDKMSLRKSSPDHLQQVRPRRRGVPLTVYINEALNERLTNAAKLRHVDKSSIVRIALERLLTQLESGQLELPLGV